jgi:hypothetical protein
MIATSRSLGLSASSPRTAANMLFQPLAKFGLPEGLGETTKIVGHAPVRLRIARRGGGT